MATPSTPESVQKLETSPVDSRLRLRESLEARFSEDELRTLCFDMWMDYDSLPGQGKAGKVRELIAYHERFGRTPEFLDQCRKRRPGVPWDDLFSLAGLTHDSAGVSLQPSRSPAVKLAEEAPEPPQQLSRSPAVKPAEEAPVLPQQLSRSPAVKPAEEAPEPPQRLSRSPTVKPAERLLQYARTRRWVFWAVFGAIIAEAAVWAWYFWLDRWVKVPLWALIIFCLLVPVLVYLVYRAIADN